MRKKIIFSLIILSLMLTIGQASYAAVEIVPSKSGDGKDAIVNTTVSNSYLLCQGMKNAGESLKGTSVKPHLATNKDWGAVSYLSNSIYGTNTQGGNNGIEVTIDNVKYYSTTTNITGVMNWGSNPNVTRRTQTAGLASQYTSGNENVTELYNNRNTKYVEYIDATNSNNTKGMSLYEMYSINQRYYGESLPTSIRENLFNGSFGYHSYGWTSGEARSEHTFRPIIWN